MWTATLDLSPRRVLLTQLLGRFWRGAYLSSFAPLRVENMPRQQLPGAQWVRVRNRLAGICGSDLHLIAVDGDLRVAPAALPSHHHTYLGHEVVGEVIEVGDDVQNLQVGDRVVLQHGLNCVAADITPLCHSCANGNYTLCERGTFSAPHPIGGGWSEEMLLSEQQLFQVPTDMTDEQAVLLEPTSVAVHAVLRHIPQANERVLIIGAGTIGLLTLQVVRTLAPQAEISVLARYPFQVEKATRMGASHIIYPQDSYREVQKVTQAHLYEGMFGNRMLLGGYDTVYDTIGNRGTIHNALRWTRARGTLVLIGVHLHFMNIDLSPVWYQEINLIGTMGQGMDLWPRDAHEPRSTFDITSDLMMQGKLHPEQLITHHFALSNYRVALQTAMDKRQGRAIKVIFDYSMQPASVVPNVRASARTSHPTTPFAPTPRISDTTTKEHEPVPVQHARLPFPSPAPISPVPSVTPVLPILPVPSAPSIPVQTPIAAPSSIPSSLADDDIATLPTIPVAQSEPAQAFHKPDNEQAASSEPFSTADIALSTEAPSEAPSDTQAPDMQNTYVSWNSEMSMAMRNGELEDVYQLYEEDQELQDRENGHIVLEETEITELPVQHQEQTEEESKIESRIETMPVVSSESEETFPPQNALAPVEPHEVATPSAQEKLPATTKSGVSKDKNRSHHAKRRKKTYYLVTPDYEKREQPEDTTHTNPVENTDAE